MVEILYVWIKPLLTEDNNLFFQYNDHSDTEIYSRIFENKEQWNARFDTFEEQDIEQLRSLSKIVNNYKDWHFFIIIEICVYEGVLVVAKPEYFYINVYEDNRQVAASKVTKFINQTKAKTSLRFCDLQRDSRLGINVWCVDSKKRSFCLGSAGMTLFTQDGHLKQKEYDIYLWPLQKFKEDLICYGSNHVGEKQSRPYVRIKLEDFGVPVKYKKGEKDDQSHHYARRSTIAKKNYEERLEYLKSKQKEEFNEESYFLPLFMKSIKHSSDDVYNMKRDWDSIDPNTALGLLQSSNTQYSSMSTKMIREHAVAKINTLSNRALANYMPQLVQALKSEPFHTSYLGEMLLQRALESPRVVGHAYFWAINASLYDKYSFERLYLNYERFLFLCNDYRKELFFQSKINDMILKISSKSMKQNDQASKKALQEKLNMELNLDIKRIMKKLDFKYFILPHIPDTPFWEVSEVMILTT